ncbi:DUF551 domain-containing protein [Escherichia coli]|uniref:DUF551 domain-containing protein n=1 Tax=Escherichia coli TaxID=562 RepID=UPI0015E5EB23|nr:DUF551 domain-containing protein [Escherichia coli]MBA1926383.1 DUF551 domain-containing protein [Escherichia coli]
MINRTKLEHILEYARQQKRFGQHCKIPPGDMVEIVEIAMRKAGNPPVTPDGWISCSERMPEGYADVLVTDGEHVEVKWWDESGYWNSWTELNSDIFADEITHWMPLPEPPQEVNRG